MPEPLHRSSDIPDFDTYPAEPPAQKTLPPTEGNTALEETARQVGSAVGKAVVTLRKTQERLKDATSQTSEAAASRISDVKNRAQETASSITETVKTKAQEWAETASARADELRQTTAQKVSELRSQIKTGYYRARLRTNQVVREYPLHVVLAAGALGFLLGVGLRIWRANRE